eukprot:scaffold6852_cov215-Ochromonas_danica.AAC.32
MPRLDLIQPSLIPEELHSEGGSIGTAVQQEAVAVEEVLDKKNTTARSPRKKKAPKPTPKELSGYIYSDEIGGYDFPFLNETKWFRLQVRKGSENALHDFFQEAKADPSHRFHGIVSSACVPKAPSYYYRPLPKKRSLKKEGDDDLCVRFKPAVVGCVYIQCSKMNPTIAKEIESLSTVAGFARNIYNFVVPLSDLEVSVLSKHFDPPKEEIDDSLRKLKRGEYVSILDHKEEGKCGRIIGIEDGQFMVSLTSDLFGHFRLPVELEKELAPCGPSLLLDASQIKYLPDLAEKERREPTLKEVVEMMMDRDPNNPNLRQLKRNGMFEELFYPNGDAPIRRPQRRSPAREWSPNNPYDQKDRTRENRNWGDESKSRPRTSTPYSQPFSTTSSRSSTSPSSSSSSYSNANRRDSQGEERTAWKKTPPSPSNDFFNQPADSSFDFDQFLKETLNRADDPFSSSNKPVEAKRQSQPSINKHAWSKNEDDWEVEGNESRAPSSASTGGGGSLPSAADFSSFDDFLLALQGNPGQKKEKGPKEVFSSFSSSSPKKGVAASPPLQTVKETTTTALPQDYSLLKKDELQALLRQKNLPVSGSKADLISRLQQR